MNIYIYIYIPFHIYIYIYCIYIKFHFAAVCSVIDSQMASQRGKNKKVALMFSPRCDGNCAPITEQTTAKWKLFVLYNKYMKK